MDWQPIETAPKDGTQILVCEDGNISVGAWDHEQNGPGASGHIQPPGWTACACGDFITDEGWDTGTGYKMRIEPTLWQQLPAPPVTTPD